MYDFARMLAKKPSQIPWRLSIINQLLANSSALSKSKKFKEKQINVYAIVHPTWVTFTDLSDLNV